VVVGVLSEQPFGIHARAPQHRESGRYQRSSQSRFLDFNHSPNGISVPSGRYMVPNRITARPSDRERTIHALAASSDSSVVPHCITMLSVAVGGYSKLARLITFWRRPHHSTCCPQT
jgi:hypothetical protein